MGEEKIDGAGSRIEREGAKASEYDVESGKVNILKKRQETNQGRMLPNGRKKRKGKMPTQLNYTI